MPAESQIITWLLTQGGGYALVAVLFYFYRRDVKDSIANWRDQKDTVLKALIADTEVKSRLTGIVEQLAHLVEHCEIRRMNSTVAADEKRLAGKR